MDTSIESEEIGTSVPERPSCQGCRRRKLKCSRESPTCSQCERLGAPCVYDAKKGKPGLRTGAVESLSRRIEVLEDALLREKEKNGGHTSHECRSHSPGNERLDGVVNLLSTVCMELCKLNNQNGTRAHEPNFNTIPRPPYHGVSVETPSQPSTAPDGYETHGSPYTQPRKRRRIDSCGNPKIELALPLEDLLDATTSLPPPELLENIVTAYFINIQPWIPILHETRFRARVHDPEQRTRLVIVIHAIIVAAIRFARPEVHGLSAADVESQTKTSRSIVVLNAMDSLSVENLQALTIIAFDDIGNGNTSRAWSIVGSLTRTVEYLRLSIEDEDDDTQRLLKPLLSLPPSKEWVEEEERRRVFWNIFNLDRFCSVATGWNTSLTADDVHRRLPADGGLWHREEQVTTPFFGIWDRSEARIGNSIAFLPAQYSSNPKSPKPAPDTNSPHSSPQDIAHSVTNSAQPDMSTVGAFAYCIEATESLSRVTTFFLQQKINFQDRREVSSWLTRFKELDLRLVHWKMFLPQKWRDSNISRQPTLIHMDPNLTLTHVTHNTSMILLHQRIAYPPAEWANIVRLPSVCSAETCQNAAIEIQNMTAKYLSNTPESSPVSNQFIFCVFVAARVLLVHWRYYGSDLAQEMWDLVDSLDQMACRWLGSSSSNGRCLASTYADHLRDLHQRCIAAPHFSVDVLGYSTVVSNSHAQSSTRSTTTGRTPTEQQSHHSRDERLYNTSPSMFANFNGTHTSTGQDISPSEPHWSMAKENLSSRHMPTNFVEAGVGSRVTTGVNPDVDYSINCAHPADELSNISYLLLDQRFMDMDRVISLDDMMFSTNMAASMNGPTG